jgi:Skp family chaperone for outer membrane proteins
MKTLKFILFSFALVSITTSINAQRGVRMGYIDMEYILESVPEYQEATTQLEGKVQKWKKELEKMNNEIEQMKLNLSNEKVLLTIELIEEREEDNKISEEEMIAYQQNQFAPGGQLDISRRTLVQPVQDQVFNIVQEIAEAKKYDFIFDKSADVVMLFAAKRNDISDQVLRSINRAAKRTEATNKREKREIEKRDGLSLEEDKEVSGREKAADDKKNERERLMDKRKMQRDSLRAVKKAEFETRRQRLLDARNRRRDSLANLRGGVKATPAGDDGDGGQ